MEERNELVIVKQIPVIEEQLRMVADEVQARTDRAKGLLCTGDTVKEVKKLRAELNKDFSKMEEIRKRVKAEVMAPYESFEKKYKEYISDRFKEADAALKAKIDETETELKQLKETECRRLFEELKAIERLDWLTFEQLGLKITLSVSESKLKEQVRETFFKIARDVEIIRRQPHPEETLCEYQKSLSFSQAVEAVRSRHESIEKARAENEKNLEAEEQEQQHIKAVQEAVQKLEPPTKEEPEEILQLTFTVRASREKLKALKKFLIDGGYDYE